MTQYTYNRLFNLSFLAISLISTNVIASPVILIKDMQDTRHTLKSTAMPSALNGVIKKIEAENPDLYKIIVYKSQNHFILYLLSGKTWSAETIRVDLDKSGNIINMINHYSAGLKTLKPSLATSDSAANDSSESCPDAKVQFLVISAYPYVAAVNDSIAIVSEAAKKKYNTMTILDEKADGQTYRNWLSCPNLKGIYSIGHGTPEGIFVGNGDLVSYDFFNQPNMKNKYKNTTVIINACQVYNYPLGSTIMFGNAQEASEFSENPGPNAYEFMGGHINLLMRVSERSSACFTAKAIEGAKMDYETLKQCIGTKNIHFQNFGLSNPGRYLDPA